MNSRNYRIRTNINQDQVVKAQLTQDIDFLEILSLKIRQEDTYKLQVSNYGIVVGRVLANESFGIPNAKVSVFIPLSDDDEMNTDITSLYPYTTTTYKNKDGIRYNLLSDSSNDKCYKVVGTFPNKTLVLDNNAEIEVFEKYWKYTTVTNQSGDYMIFGVPTGSQEIHVDVDLSDIGVLSQKPRDMMYKGYGATLFDNANQFKESTNLENLTQLLTQNSTVNVYPFFGDSNMGEIAITRCDLQVQYKFEPTCVFFGSIVSDDLSNNIGDKCNPSKFCGFNRNLVAGEGTIEMIRKTANGLVEEFQIQGNRLIDGDGVWCYQIPMNLDYIETDEFGNIVPTDNPNRGIPTRTSVRFRISMQETNNEGISRHRAKYLVPNNVPFTNEEHHNFQSPTVNVDDYEFCYEFGSATPDEYFRDLYWNKVYSVKNYIPRIQTTKKAKSQKYSAIRTVNDSRGKNPFPFNNARFKLFFSYKLLCILITMIVNIVGALNRLITIFSWIGKQLRKIKLVGKLLQKAFNGIQNALCKVIKCIGIRGISETEEGDNIEYFPHCENNKCMSCKEKNCVKSTDTKDLLNNVEQTLAEEYDTVNLDFYNDWINGCLYMPLWFWKKTKKRKYFFGLFRKKAVNRFCNCDNKRSKLYVVRGCALDYDDSYNLKTKTNISVHDISSSIRPNYGVVKEKENKQGLNVYYYAPGVVSSNDGDYVMLYSTDIILLGSLNDCDIDNYPKPYINLPSTTANIPFIRTLKAEIENEEDDKIQDGDVEVSGMDWTGNITQGLFMDLTCTSVSTRPKTCINLYRLSELGVSLDTSYDDVNPEFDVEYTNKRIADGLITRYELIDNETRAMFASLNHNGLAKKIRNNETGYEIYDLEYKYPTDFDGHMSKFATDQTKSLGVVARDKKDDEYVLYRLGNNKFSYNTSFPLYNNSFYFYFGLNEGNTAIDKFNKLFYAECVQNSTSAFEIICDIKPAKLCITNEETDYGKIYFNFKGIHEPYDFRLYNVANALIVEKLSEKNHKLSFENNFTDDVKVENGEYIVEVTDMYGNMITKTISVVPIKINAQISSNRLGVEYTKDSIKDDICSSEQNGTVSLDNITIDGDELCDFTSNTYKITYKKDDNGNDIKFYKLINIYNENGDLIDSFIENLTETENLYFKVIDGDKRKIKNVNEIGNKIYDEDDNELSGITTSSSTVFVFYITKNNKNIIQAHAEYYNSLFVDDENEDNIQYALCVDDVLIDENKGSLVLKFWTPGTFNIVLSQICNSKINYDNIVQNTIDVNNGEQYITYVNDVPTIFLKETFNVESAYKTSDDGKNGNWYFYPKMDNPDDSFVYNDRQWSLYNYDDDFQNTPSSINQDNYEKWSKFVELETVKIEKDENEPILLTEDFTTSSKANFLRYKIECFLNFIRHTFITDSFDNNVYITSKGGNGISLKNASYLNYGEIDSELNNKYEQYLSVLTDTDGYVTCDYNYPNVVCKNYAQYISGVSYPTYIEQNDGYDIKYFPNDIIGHDDKDIYPSNYLAIFNNSQTYPTNAKKIIDDNTIKITSSYDKNVKDYFRWDFVDKRLDFELFVKFLPVEANCPYGRTRHCNYCDKYENCPIKSRMDKKGKYIGIHGNILNCLRLSFDDEKNMLCSGRVIQGSRPQDTYVVYDNEYYYDFKTLNFKKQDNSNNLTNKKSIYSAYTTTFIDRNKKELGENALTDNEWYSLRYDDCEFDEVNQTYNENFGYLSITLTNCEYPDSVDYESDSGKLVGVVGEGENVTIKLQTNNVFRVITDYDSLLENAENNFCHYEITLTEGGDDNWVLKNSTIKVKINSDKYNDTHRIVDYQPFFIRLDGSNGLSPKEEYLSFLFNVHNDENIKLWKPGNEALKKDLERGPFSRVVQYIRNSAWDWTGWHSSIRQNNFKRQQVISKTRFDYPQHEWYGRLLAHQDPDSLDDVLSEDDTTVKEAVYSYKLMNNSVSCLVLFRSYLYNSSDTLLRNVTTMHTSLPINGNTTNFLVSTKVDGNMKEIQINFMDDKYISDFYDYDYEMIVVDNSNSQLEFTSEKGSGSLYIRFNVSSDYTGDIKVYIKDSLGIIRRINYNVT